MQESRMVRYSVIAVLLLLGVSWSFSRATGQEKDKSSYPNGELLVSADWLAEHRQDVGVVIVDVRTDKYYDGKVIPEAIRLPWSVFREHNGVEDTASTFVGTTRAQKILGDHGIPRNSKLVLYDSVARDGGATASYVFWILDVLGHEDIKILNGGIDAWVRAGHQLTTTIRQPEALTYQAPTKELQPDAWMRGDNLYERLGDRHYEIIDVRSKAEYLGEKGTKGLTGEPLKLGHVPGAVNINYEDNWIDTERKQIKSYGELQVMYRGLDSKQGVVVYCNSGRRSSFSYFILRLMGFSDVRTYEASWKEWGNPDNFYPVETRENIPEGDGLPTSSASPVPEVKRTSGSSPDSARSTDGPGGYVSCGG